MSGVPAKTTKNENLGKLRNGKQFRAVYSGGLRFHSRYFSVFILPTDTGELRFGITATRKIGKAVVRNRCKRRIREVFRRHLSEDLRGFGCDLVVNAKPELATADFGAVVKAVEQTLRRFQTSLTRTGRGEVEIDNGNE